MTSINLINIGVYSRLSRRTIITTIILVRCQSPPGWVDKGGCLTRLTLQGLHPHYQCESVPDPEANSKLHMEMSEFIDVADPCLWSAC